jgi:hypothetical protein
MDDAIKAFERAVQNGDSEGLAICQLSELYIETGRVMDGIQMLECNVQHVMQVAPQRSSVACRSCAAAEPRAALSPKSAVHDAPCDTVCDPFLVSFSPRCRLPHPPPAHPVRCAATARTACGSRCSRFVRRCAVVLPCRPTPVTPPPPPIAPSLRFWSARLHQVTATLSGGAG